MPTNTKHTPGPWKYNHGLTYFRKAHRLIKTELVVGAKGEWVAAVINDYEDGTPVKVQQANARLMAAAPELLEALEAVEAWWFNGETDANVHMPHHVESMIRAAIAKAKGE